MPAVPHHDTSHWSSAYSSVPIVVSKLSVPASNNIAIASVIQPTPLFPPWLWPPKTLSHGEDINGSREGNVLYQGKKIGMTSTTGSLVIWTTLESNFQFESARSCDEILTLKICITTCSSRELCSCGGDIFLNSFNGPKGSILWLGREMRRCKGEASMGKPTEKMSSEGWRIWSIKIGLCNIIEQHIKFHPSDDFTDISNTSSS